MFTDADAAALYDLLYAWDGTRFASVSFYDSLVMAAGAVLDVGCGTGQMLRHAREAGHRGRLVGLDPDLAALERARSGCPELEWVAGKAADARWDREFELATMTSHAFQFLVDDDEVHASLVAIRAALSPGGRLAFETRHPQARAWDQWQAAEPAQVVDHSGRVLRQFHQVEGPDADVVSVTETTTDADGTVLRVDQARMRFLDVVPLRGFLTRAGFEIEEQFGDWERGPITAESREIITIARRAEPA